MPSSSAPKLRKDGQPDKRFTGSNDRLLRLVADMRVADLELLQLVLIRNGFGVHAVRWATETLLKRGHLHRLWKHRSPKFRMDRGSARQVFLLSGTGAEHLKLPSKPAEKWFTYLKDPRKEYVLEHELMIARFHAACVKSGLQEWHQGEGTQVKGHGVQFRPDAFFKLGERYYFLEADTGSERIDSDDDSRRTIAKKIRKYGVADRDEIPQEQFEIPGFSVVFLVPLRSDPRRASGRELSILQAFEDYGRRRTHARDFYSVISETDVMETLRTGRPLPLFAKGVTLEGESARPALPTS